MRYQIKNIFIVIFLFLSSCALFQTHTIKTENLPPRETDVPGWRLNMPPANYDSDNLNEYIKDPEFIRLYGIYGFRELSVAEYVSFSDPQKEILVEVFHMNSPLNAFGILSIERSGEIKKVDVCNESYSTPRGLFSSIGSYYIRIRSETRYSNLHDDLKIFLKIIRDKIEKPDNSLQPFLSLFGEEKRLTLKYQIEGDSRLRDLNNIFIRTINLLETEKTIFFAKRNSSYLSIAEFSKLLKNKENPFILSSAEELQTAFRRLNDNEIIFIALYNEWIFGVLDAESMIQGEKIIYYMYNNILKF